MIKHRIVVAAAALFALVPIVAFAQSVQSSRPIKINTVITQDDLVLVDTSVPGAIERIEDALGLETRKTLYPGRPIMVGDLGPKTVIERNQLVQITFSKGALRIATDGRSLGRAALGQRIRVMNSDTRLIVTGVVTSSTNVEVHN